MSLTSPRILMLMQEDPYKPGGGLGVHVFNICEQLKKDFNITVIGLNTAGLESGFFVGKEKVLFEDWEAQDNEWRLLKAFPINDLNFSDPLFDNYTIHNCFTFNMISFLKREKFDLIHIHDAPLYRVAKLGAAFWEVPIVLTVHLSFYFGHQYKPEMGDLWKYAAQTEATALNDVDRLITVSEAYRKKINKYLYIPLKEIEVVLNGVDYNFLSGISYDLELKRELLKDREKLIVFVGRPVPSKGIELILKAAEELPNYQFIIIAQIVPSVEIGSTISCLKEAPKNVIWYNELEQAKKWKIMKVADSGVMPSLHEPFGITALEWMSLSTPLITSGKDGLSDFCNSSNSKIVDPTKSSLVKALKEEATTEQIENGLRTARSYTWRSVAEKIKRIYDECTDSN